MQREPGLEQRAQVPPAAPGYENSGAASAAATAGPETRDAVGRPRSAARRGCAGSGRTSRPSPPTGASSRRRRRSARRQSARRARGVVALHRLPRSPRARRRTARGSARAPRDALGGQDRLVVVADLVAQVAEHRAVGLVELRARAARGATGSASARSSVMTPSAWPVVTGSTALESRSNASGRRAATRQARARAARTPAGAWPPRRSAHCASGVVVGGARPGQPAGRAQPLGGHGRCRRSAPRLAHCDAEPRRSPARPSRTRARCRSAGIPCSRR